MATTYTVTVSLTFDYDHDDVNAIGKKRAIMRKLVQLQKVFETKFDATVSITDAAAEE